MEGEALDELRGAICLNNYGVALLEKACYTQAHDTLRDACTSMKAIVFRRRHNLILGDTEGDLKLYLRFASLRFANPEPSSVLVPIKALSDDASPSGMGFALKSISANDMIVHVIRVDKNDHQPADELDLDVVAASVLLNCGCARLCEAIATTNNADIAQNICFDALQLLSLCYLACNSLILKSSQLRLVYIVMVLFQAFMKCYTTLGMFEKANDWSTKVDYLRLVAQRYEDALSSVFGPSHVSAAA